MREGLKSSGFVVPFCLLNVGGVERRKQTGWLFRGDNGLKHTYSIALHLYKLYVHS